MTKERNMAAADRAVRTLLAGVVVALWGTGTIGGTLALILGVVAAIFLVTSLVGWCPLYSLLGVSTLRGDGTGGSTAH